MELSKKSSSIEFLRFYFMLVIALGHFNSCEGLMVQGFSPVEFFFILSGFLIFRSAQRHPQQTVFEYTWHKVKRFFPEYFAALILCTIIHFVSYWHNGLTEDLFSFSQCFISEALFLQAIGFLQSNINYPCWYLSVLVIGGAFVFAVIKYNCKLATTIVLPCIVLFSYTLLFTRFDTIEQWGSIGFMSLPLLRGIAGMSLGAVLSSIEVESLSHQKNRRILDIVATLSFCILNYSIFTGRITYPLVVLLYSILIVFCFVDGGVFNSFFDKPVSLSLGGISFEMLIFHTSVMYVCRYICTELSLSIGLTILLYISLLVSFSFIVKKLFSRWVVRS